MQHIIGSALRILGLVVIICTILFLIIGLTFGVKEALALDGPSQYDQIYLVLKLGGVGLICGALIRWFGRLVTRSAPPLEEVKIPIDPNL